MKPATIRTNVRHATGLYALAGLVLLALAPACRQSTSEVVTLPDAAQDLVTPAPPADGTGGSLADAGAQDPLPARSVVLAGGCFWCTEAVFEELAGVTDVVSGYAGGKAETADYKKVSAGATEHAEVIQVTYDPARVSYGQLLKVFFSVAHDPTQLNYQGPDHGTQYRSAVFYADEDERETAAAYIQQLTDEMVYREPIATTLEPLDAFYAAEEYHQDFVRNNPRHGYVVRYALPKVAKVREYFAELLKPE